MLAAVPDTSVSVVPVEETGEAADLGSQFGALELPRGVGLLVVARGSDEGARFVLERDVTTAGRHPDSDVFLDDVSVSRHHGIFTKTASGRITVRDLNSLNGTYVNSVRVEETTLHSGDEVQIGKFKLIFWGAAS